MSMNDMRTSLQQWPGAQRSALAIPRCEINYLVKSNEGRVSSFEVVVGAVDQICEDLTARHATKPVGFDIAL